MQGEKVEISAYSISKKTRFVGYFSDTSMNNLLFQRKCVNSALESIYSWVSQHLVTTWSKFGQPNYKYSRQRYSHIFSEKVNSYWYHWNNPQVAFSLIYCQLKLPLFLPENFIIKKYGFSAFKRTFNHRLRTKVT